MTFVSDQTPKSPFRQSALARLNNPEQLDRLLTVTTARSWIALAVFLALIVTALGWSVFGRLSTYVTGRGLFLNEGGRLVAAAAPGSGTLSVVLVKQGDSVEKGQLVARLVSPEAQTQIVNATELVSEREGELDRQRTFTTAETNEKRAGFARRRADLRRQQEAARARSASLKAKLDDEQRLLRDKIVTRATVLQTTAQVDQIEQEVNNDAAQITLTDNQELDIAFQGEQRIKNAEFNLADARRRLAELTEANRAATEVVAPMTGTVEAIDANIGSLLTRGQPILTVETPGRHLEFVLFVSIRDGDQIEAGEPVNVSPNWTRREEEGTMIGTVREITKFPVTPEGLRSLVQNEDLVRSFSGQGPVFMAYVRLKRDSGTASGYAWTSSKGAEEPITSGGFGSADVMVKRERPIGLVIPTLRRWAGV
jgi:HlyD family secretion protein